MTYVYAIMWLVIGVILFFKFAKESKIFYLLSFFFVLMAAWWFVDGLMPELDVLQGDYGLVLRIIGGIVLAVVLLFYYKQYYLKGKK